MAKAPGKTTTPTNVTIFEDVVVADCEGGSDELMPDMPKSRGMGLAGAAKKKPAKKVKLPAWRVAKALETLRSQVNVLAPKRSTVSDGAIGDSKHWPKGASSDHNPWVKDGKMSVVTARDITHDKKNGCDCNALAESLRSGKDARLKYVIWNKRIFSSFAKGASAAWTWRKYSGKNPHDKHIHISVNAAKKHYDGTGLWSIKVK